MKYKIIILFTLIALGAISWFGYSYFCNKNEIRENAKNICHVYLYDIANPSAHQSFAPDHHGLAWAKFEARFGPTGAESIDEFCEMFK